MEFEIIRKFPFPAILILISGFYAAEANFRNIFKRDECKNVWGDVKPDPTRCYGFILCVLGQGIFIPCGKDQIFDPVVRNCVTGDRETCENSGETTQLTTTTGSTSTTTASEVI